MTAPTPAAVLELAEIGRLAVEWRRLFINPNTILMDNQLAHSALVDAIDTYLAKETKP